MAQRPSSIDRLPPEVKSLIGALRQGGRTIDEILAKLGELDVEVSRSALGRHIQTLATVGEKIQRSRDLALALTERFGDQPDNQMARLNLELLHNIVFDTINATEEDENGETRPMTFGPLQAKALAQALQSLASAEKIDADRQMKIREVAKRTGGLTKETVEAIKAEILGVRA